MARGTKAEPLSQRVERLVQAGAEMHIGTRRNIAKQIGDRPYDAKKLSPEEELRRYREEQRHDPEFWKELLISERERLGFPDLTSQGKPYIPKVVIKEMLRIEALHRGEEED